MHIIVYTYVVWTYMEIMFFRIRNSRVLSIVMILNDGTSTFGSDDILIYILNTGKHIFDRFFINFPLTVFRSYMFAVGVTTIVTADTKINNYIMCVRIINTVSYNLILTYSFFKFSDTVKFLKRV